MFEEVLIGEIEKHTCLWDKRELCYRDRVKKDLAWRNIAAVVGECEENCRKRWKSLRDRYGIDLKVQHQPSGSAATHKRGWAYFDAMSFLKATVTPRHSRTTTNITLVTPDVWNEQHDTLDASFGFALGDSGAIEITEPEAIAPTPAKRQKKKADDNFALNDLVSDVSTFLETQKTKTDDHFLGAIGEVFDKVPEERRLDFKMDVLLYVHGQFKKL